MSQLCLPYSNTHLTEVLYIAPTAAVTETELIQVVREVKVVDIGVNFFKLAWRKTPGVSGYKISWSPFHGEGGCNAHAHAH